MGEERANWQYLFASLERAGAELACGSDWPVSSPDPWQAMHVAVNRQEPGVTDFAPLLPDEALSLNSILTAYTRGSHRLLGMPGGSIEVGAVCDVAVADRDPFLAYPAQIHLTRNRVTVLAGEVVFEAA
jgi:predicted amidohydrolase YtcJ